MNLLKSVYNRFFVLLENAFKYNLIRGAAIVKFLQVLAQLTGHIPWDEQHNLAVETGIDFLVALAALCGVGQAHDNIPTKAEIQVRKEEAADDAK